MCKSKPYSVVVQETLTKLISRPRKKIFMIWAL